MALLLPRGADSATLTVEVTSSILRSSGERTTSVTNYTVVARRAVQVAEVTGQGFEMRTAIAGGGNVAWRDRKWSFSQLPAALVLSLIMCSPSLCSCGFCY